MLGAVLGRAVPPSSLSLGGCGTRFACAAIVVACVLLAAGGARCRPGCAGPPRHRSSPTTRPTRCRARRLPDPPPARTRTATDYRTSGLRGAAASTAPRRRRARRARLAASLSRFFPRLGTREPGSGGSCRSRSPVAASSWRCPRSPVLPAALLLPGPAGPLSAAGLRLAANPLIVQASSFGTATRRAAFPPRARLRADRETANREGAAFFAAAIVFKQFTLVAIPFAALMITLVRGRLPRGGESPSPPFSCVASFHSSSSRIRRALSSTRSPTGRTPPGSSATASPRCSCARTS